MRIIQNLSIIVVLALLTSCATTTKFPVSNETPAADITAKTKKQGTNYHVTITALNLAASDRLTPPKRFYIIWAVSETGVTRNIGNFHQKNGVESVYEASFPYEIVEIFITAEDDEGSCWPSGTEITRIKFQ